MKNRIDFKSEHKNYGLRIYAKEFEKILEMCTKSGRLETGGRLMGYYTTRRDLAIVTDVLAPTEDTKHGLFSLSLGINGLNVLFNYLWHKRRIYYIGDWHFHPYSSPEPSGTDLAQLKQIAGSKQYNCPEPILLIVGGNPKKEWISRVFVFVKKNGYLELNS